MSGRVGAGAKERCLVERQNQTKQAIKTYNTYLRLNLGPLCGGRGTRRGGGGGREGGRGCQRQSYYCLAGRINRPVAVACACDRGEGPQVDEAAGPTKGTEGGGGGGVHGAAAAAGVDAEG